MVNFVQNDRAFEIVTDTEQALVPVWKEVLQITQPIAPGTDFFELGGDSMTMVMLEFRIQEEFGVRLPPGAILEAPTLSDLAAMIDSEKSSLSQ